MVGGGGFLINLEGMKIDRYAWVLGKKTNNQAEEYALLFVLIIAKQRGIRVMNIPRDSLIIIKHMVNNSAA